MDDILDVKKSNYLNIQFVIDSNPSLVGKQLRTMKIVSPDLIKDWKELFIIITVENGKDEIAAFLKEKELIYGSDYIVYNDLYNNVRAL